MKRLKDETSHHVCHGLAWPTTSQIDTLDSGFSLDILLISHPAVLYLITDFENMCVFLLGFILVFFVLQLTSFISLP